MGGLGVWVDGTEIRMVLGVKELDGTEIRMGLGVKALDGIILNRYVTCFVLQLANNN